MRTGGPLSRSADGDPIPVATGFVMVDNSASPKTSPVTADASETSLKFPANAIRLYVYAPDADVTLRKVAGGATGGTFTIPAATVWSIPGVAGDTIYINRASSTALEFCFDTVA